MVVAAGVFGTVSGLTGAGVVVVVELLCLDLDLDLDLDFLLRDLLLVILNRPKVVGAEVEVVGSKPRTALFFLPNMLPDMKNLFQCITRCVF